METRIRSHQNRRRKLDEYQRVPENYSQYQQHPSPNEDINSFRQFKQVKLHDNIYQNPQIENLLEFRNYSLWAKNDQGLPNYYQWNKPYRQLSEDLLNAKSYNTVNSYLKQLHLENQAMRKQQEEAEKTERGEMIMEEIGNEEVVEPTMQTETSETNEVVRNQVEEFYEFQNRYLFELYLARNNTMREE